MSEKRCKFCTGIIYWIPNGDKWKPFDDEAGSALHRCNIQQREKTTEQRISDLEDSVRTLYHIVESHSKKLNGE